jgi:hypothetical protein
VDSYRKYFSGPGNIPGGLDRARRTGGYEDVGAVEAVNCMLLLSVEGFIRFFPAWPVGERASFK